MEAPETEPRHGERGWDLLAYEWDEETGVGRFWYHRETRDFAPNGQRGANLITEKRKVERQQMVPACPRRVFEAQS